MTETRRARITRALQDIDTWRASGMKLKAYAQSRNEELSHWRAQLSWERRWRQALDPAPNTAPPNTAPPNATFVRALPIKHAKHANAMPTQDACLRIVLGKEGSALHARIDWPLDAVQACGAWLREVLA
jgi:hypothetical protein